MVLDGYIRVSRVAGRDGESFISPTLQREQIEAWATGHGATLGEFFEELDASGGRRDRPLLLRAIERIEGGESDGLVVAKLNRFARSVIDGLTFIARIEKAGGTFVSVADGFDLGTPTGKMAMRILLAVAEWEFDIVRENWDTARSKAIERGVYVSRLPPLGYARGKDGRLRPRPELRRAIVQAFQMRGDGATLQKIADSLNEAGVRSNQGGLLTPPKVEFILRNRAYLGEARSGEFSNRTAHEPLVDPATWQRAQRIRQPRRSTILPLVGLVRCASCGRRMNAFRAESRGSPSPVYACHGKRARGGCPGPARARSDEIEPLVEELVFDLARRGGAAGTVRVVEDEEVAVRVAESNLDKYRDNSRLQDTLGMTSFEHGLAARQERLERALLELARARRAAERPSVDLYDLETTWGSLGLQERRAAVEEFLDAVYIERGQGSAIARAWVCRRGGMPVEADRRRGPQPFDPDRDKARRLPAPPRWSARRISTELREFLGEREHWPVYAEFEKAGYGRLYGQIIGWGGPFYWAQRFGLQIEPPDVRWSPDRVRGALGPVLKGRDRWPSARELREAGFEALYRACVKHGGIGFWAGEFGLAPPRAGSA